MKTSEADILILPGLGGGEGDHWYDRWANKLKTARRIEQKNWHQPDRNDWTRQITRAVEQAERPVVLIGHSLGVLAAVHALPVLPREKVVGGYFVAPPMIEQLLPNHLDAADFYPVPEAPFSFPAILVASQTDPYCPFDKAEDMSFAWGAKLENAGESGHINSQSGQGPWPEGLLSFANFMARL